MRDRSVARAERIRQAVFAIDSRGEQPTARSVLRELGQGPYLQDNGYGTVIDNGMGGRDLRLFATAMESAGYRRVQRGFSKRWVKVN